MTRVVDFPDRGVVADEAAAWLIRLDADAPPDSEELRVLGEWLHRSPVHREELERLAALWGRMNVLTELAVPLCASRRTTPRIRVPVMIGRASSLWRVGWIAAALCLGIALLLLRQAALQRIQSTNGLYATAVGQHQSVKLSDGSQIALNTNTQVKVEYEKSYRRVHLLQGEALFDVAKDADRPFRVYAGSSRIEALGTSFSVYLHGSRIKVAVTEGRVALASATRDTVSGSAASGSMRAPPAGASPDDHMHSLGTLDAWQIATISAEPTASVEAALALEAIRPVAPAELQERLAWRDGMLVFSGETIGEVVKEFSRYTTVVIEVPDPLVRAMRVGGRFPVGETDTMLAVLETNFNLRVTRVGRDHVILSAAK